ncbi:probable cytochrome P450 6a13 [Culex quinquefasciatus]|uniref:probable cytochrome P450 6a13 n=1 Tax=Culex quinquefasciatus TaxID=7176 RepID=UPI0018E2B904|nr:probable cytochrome P450 6a13 [Culex quinquefasciatus]
MIVTATFLLGLAYTKPMVFALVVFVGFLILALFKYNFRHWQRENVPGPKPSLLTGNLGPTLTMKKHIGQLCEEWYKEFPNEPFIGYFKVFKPAVMLRDPDLIKSVLVKDFGSFAANDFPLDEKVDPLLAHNPFMVTGERWKTSRQLLTPIFTVSKMKQLFPMMEQVSKQFVEYVGRQLGKDVEAKSISAAFTTQNVAGCAFSLDAECFDNPKSEWREMGKKVFQPTFLAGIKFTLMMFLPVVTHVLPVPFVPTEVNDWMRNMVSKLLAERRTKPVQREDQLQSLLNLKTKTELTEEMIAGHSLAFFTEGFETSSTTLGFLIYNLAANPEVQQKLYEEIKAAMEANNDTLSYDVMQQIDYLDWTLQESLRINPPLASMTKLCTKNYSLKREINGQLVGTWIKAGTPVLIPLLAIHMDAKYYPEPQKFRPERFCPEEKAARGSQMVYFPFGEGPRMCMGMRFAQTQVKVALLQLVLNFRMTVSPNHKPFALDTRTLLVQAKDGLTVRFERR